MSLCVMLWVHCVCYDTNTRAIVHRVTCAVHVAVVRYGRVGCQYLMYAWRVLGVVASRLRGYSPAYPELQQYLLN